MYCCEPDALAARVAAMASHWEGFRTDGPDDAERLDDLAPSPDVRVILVRDHSLDRYDVRGAETAD